MRRPVLVAFVAASVFVACDKRPDSNATQTAAAAPVAISDAAAPVKLCEHGVPADLCTKCDAALVPVFKATGDWCDEHGVPESQCLQCNPGLVFGATDAPADWCKEHAVPESKCTKCHPNLVAKFIEAGDFCREHGFPESVCPRCHPELVPGGAGEVRTFDPGTVVRLAAADTENDVGIETTVARARPFASTLSVVGQLDFDRGRFARLSARSESVVLRVLVDVGDEVKAGQPVVMLASAGVGANRAQVSAARARVDAAERALERDRSLQARGISTQREVDQAARELAAAQGEEEAAGAALQAAGATTGRRGTYTLTAPLAGVVVGRPATPGRAVDADDPLVEIADLRAMWAELDVPEEQSTAVRRGQRVTLRFDALRGEVREGVVARVSPSIDEHTRTVRTRVVLLNPGGVLKAGLFFRADVVVASPKTGILVPRLSVQYAEGRPLVFVRGGQGVYRPVAVELGVPIGDDVEILTGLTGGEELVTTGAFLLKTEILKDSIGAGCCEGGE